jgi:hypothetical protein
MMVGRKLQWNVEKEEIIGDPSASLLMSRVFRPPYQM